MLLLLATLTGYCAKAQSIAYIKVLEKESMKPLPAAVIKLDPGNIMKVADSSGIATFKNIPAGKYSVKLTFVGYEEAVQQFEIKENASETITVWMHPKQEETEEEVVVSATRISRSIANDPTRVEVISGEELAEKANMKPGDIRTLLTETTGIQTQQTSATSMNAGMRIQGLDGRYTQLLKDGYPLYSGFAGGLSILQIPPLDLKQVELIKGSASTLYGGGAIAGLVNLVSKIPTDERAFNFLINGTSAGGLDISGFYGEKYGKTGLTLYGATNLSSPYDPANNGLTAIPKSRRYHINPRMFYYGNKFSMNVGVAYTTERRTGGSMDYIKYGTPGYFEKNNSARITTQSGFAWKIDSSSTIQFKNSVSHFRRKISIPSYDFEASQLSLFSELSWMKRKPKTDWVAGANFQAENLQEFGVSKTYARDYTINTTGFFVQNALSVSRHIVLESGIRTDFVKNYGLEFLPRISVLAKLSTKVTARLGGGLGYKTPTIFTEESEKLNFQNILPLNAVKLHNERSKGVSFDVNFKSKIGEIYTSLNGLIFYTNVSHTLMLIERPLLQYAFENSPGHLDTKGLEANAHFTFRAFKYFLGYTYTDANTHVHPTKIPLTLTARHRINNVLMYEVENKIKVGLEAYYIGPQPLSNGGKGRDYWITGLMIEKPWKKLSFYINFENFTDTRQTRFDTLFTGSINSPTFRDIYAPLDEHTFS